MRVLHLLKTSDGAKWAWRQMRELKALGVDVQVVLPGSGPMARKYADAGIPVHMLDCDFGRIRSLPALRRAKGALRALVGELKPSVIHSHFVGTTLLARLARGTRTRIPMVFQVPGPLHLESRLSKSADLLTAGDDDYWIASCRRTRQLYLAAGIAAARVGLSFYGTDVEGYAFGRAGWLRQVLGVSESAQVLGMVAYAYRPKRWLGQRTGLKGHEDLIDATALLRREGRDITLVIVGGPWLGAEAYFGGVKKYARATLGENAVFLGHRSDVADIYADLTVAVHPSHSENLGGAVESLLAAAPTVATDVGGLPDIVIDGKTGWLCEARSPRSLADAIGAALDSPNEAKRRALAGQQLVRRELDVRRTAAQVHHYYQRLCNERGLEDAR